MVGAVLICAGLAVVGLGAHTLTDSETHEVVATRWLITGLLAAILGVGILALAPEAASVNPVYWILGGVLVTAIAVGASGGCGTSPGGVGTPSAGDHRKAAERAQERRKGHHCLSPWDGNHDGLTWRILCVCG